MAALGCDQRMQFVEDDIAQVCKEALRLAIGDQQRQLLGRGEQDVGGRELLALALALRRIAGARLDADGQAHLADRLHQVALDINRERLERRDIKRVDALKRRARLSAPAICELGQRGHEAG